MFKLFSSNSKHCEPFSMGPGAAPGFEALEAPKLLGQTEYGGRMVATTVIGRTAGTHMRVFEWLLNPTWHLPEGKFGDSILDSVVKNSKDKVIHMADFGCGGAADSPILEKLANEYLVRYSKEFKLKSFDLDSGVVSAVKNGRAPYFISNKFPLDLGSHVKNFDPNNYPFTFCDERITSRIQQYIDEDFTLIGMKKLKFPHEDLYDVDNELKQTLIYRMRDSTRAALDIEVGDIQRTSLKDNSLDIVSCCNVSLYMRDYQIFFAFKEVERILRDGGFFITDGALFQKKDGVLDPAPISGYGFIQQNDGYERLKVEYKDGLHPTVYRNGKYEPTIVRELNSSGFWNPHYGFKIRDHTII